jgi:hypothetical protein
MRSILLRCGIAAFAVLPCAGAFAAAPPLAAVTVIGPPEVVFAAPKDACDGHDAPDAPARAFRDAKGEVVLFATHYRNRALRGKGLDQLKLDCRVVLEASGREDPAAYDDKSWITATWTDDGVRVEALVHHEYQANHHPGRCKAGNYMACWYSRPIKQRPLPDPIGKPLL